VEARGHGIDHVEAEAHGFTYVAYGAAAAVGDDGGGHAGAVAAVFGVQVLDDLFPPLVLEVDVDVGRLVAGGADEPLEQQVDPGRVDRGDAKAIAHRGIGGRPASLAQNSPRPGELYQVIDGEEVRLE